MKKKIAILCSLMVLSALVFAQTSAAVRVLPTKWSVSSKGQGLVKAEISGVDPKTIDASSIQMNGVTSHSTQIATKKMIAHFSQKAVMATLGTVHAGQTVTITVAFSAAGTPYSVNNTVTISGSPRK